VSDPLARFARVSPSRGGDYACNMRALFSPSVRGRAAEGGRGSLSHVLAEPVVFPAYMGKLSSVTLPVMSCSRSRWINVGSGYVRNHKDTETQRAQGKTGSEGSDPVFLCALCVSVSLWFVLSCAMEDAADQTRQLPNNDDRGDG
jgi:hypothetical protein